MPRHLHRRENTLRPFHRATFRPVQRWLRSEVRREALHEHARLHHAGCQRVDKRPRRHVGAGGMARVATALDVMPAQVEIFSRLGRGEGAEKLLSRRIARRARRWQQVVRVLFIALARMSGEGWRSENRECEDSGEEDVWFHAGRKNGVSNSLLATSVAHLKVLKELIPSQPRPSDSSDAFGRTPTSIRSPRCPSSICRAWRRWVRCRAKCGRRFRFR